MKTLLLFFAFLMALPAFGQITASPGAITVYARRGLGGYPWYGTTPPTDTVIAISGTGVWNISRGGDLNTACSAGAGYCFNAVQTVTNFAAGPIASGSGPGTVYLTWRGLGTQELPLGTYTGTLTIGITVIQITLVVTPANAFDAMVYPPGFPSGCANSSPNYIQADTCAITGERPASTAFAIPAPGGTYVDPQFGHTVKRLTASDRNIQYGALSAFSANAKYVVSSIGGLGVTQILDRATGAVVYDSLPGVNLNFAAWDPTDDEKLWYTDGGTLRYRVLNTGTVVIAADYTSASGTRPAFAAITNGGTVDITDDAWWAFRDYGNILCAVNLNGLTTVTQEAKTICADMTALALTDVDFTQITQVDKESRKRYVVVLSLPQGHVYSVGLAGLNYEFPLPSLLREPHSDVGQDDEGRQIFFWNFGEIYGNRTYLATMQINKGLDMLLPVEAGGGLRLLYNDEPADFTYETDGHFGCTWRGVCVHTPYGNSNGIGARLISGVTPGTPCGISTAIGHGYASGDQILIGGATGINGIFTITVTGPNNYTLNGHTCTSGYTANSANSVKNVATTTDKPNRQEIIMVRPGGEVRRLAIHRSKIYTNGSSLLGYFASPRASISRDGRYVAYASNYGIPEQPSIWVVDAGASITTARVALKGIDAADTEVVINYEVPAGETAAAITVSASPELTAPVVGVSDGATAPSRQYVATGLTADTVYYCRIHTGRYSVTGSFRTAPAITGTGTLRVQSGNGSVIQHGSTAALGSSGASPLEVTVSRGVYYYNAGGGTQAVVVR